MNIDDDIIRAGDMDRRIEIQEPTVSQNSYGEATASFTTIDSGERWAELKFLAGQELVRAKQVNASVSVAFIMRWTAGITPKHRVYLPDLQEGTDRYFDINAVLPLGRKQKLVLLCNESN